MGNFDIQAAEIALLDFFKDEDVTNNTNLIETNKIDSIGIIDLTLYIEDRFGVEIYMEEITKDNFCTISNIANFLKSKLET